MTKDEKAISDIVGAICVAFGCLCKSIEQQTNGDFNSRGLATSINDAASAIPKNTENRALIVTVLTNMAAELNQQLAQKALLPFPDRALRETKN